MHVLIIAHYVKPVPLHIQWAMLTHVTAHWIMALYKLAMLWHTTAYFAIKLITITVCSHWAMLVHVTTPQQVVDGLNLNYTLVTLGMHWVMLWPIPQLTNLEKGNLWSVLFSSPELKAQVSFSDHLSSVICLSVCPSIQLSVNFSHFHLLLQNHWANFN